MPAVIETLIDSPDRSEQIRDQIAAILALEVEEQRGLALAAIPPKDELDWTVRVFTEASNPWSEWADSPDSDTLDATPIVNVTLASISFDLSASSVVHMQKGTARYHVDCYGYGKARDVEGGGHVPGDQAAGLEVARAMRLVRNILMAGHYTYLLLRKTVERRWLESVTFFDRQFSERTVQNVVGARMVFAVDFREGSPQVQGQDFEILSLQVKRASTGEIYVAALYDDDS